VSPKAARHRERLLAARQELLGEKDHEVRIAERTSPVASKVDDDAKPLTVMTQVIASNRNAERKRRLAKIDAALVRLRANPDSFDLCDSCDEPLIKRLALMPWSRLCIECQAEEDEANRYGGRRSLTDFIA